MKKATANFSKPGDDNNEDMLMAVKEEVDSDLNSKMGMSLNGGGSTSGAGTLVGDNMALGDDPFNGRHNMFGGKGAGRNTCNLDALADKGDFRLLDDDMSECTTPGSIVSGRFGQITAN